MCAYEILNALASTNIKNAYKHWQLQIFKKSYKLYCTSSPLNKTKILKVNFKNGFVKIK